MSLTTLDLFLYTCEGLGTRLVLNMFRVEVLVTGIKIESSNQRPFWGLIKVSRIAKIN